MLASLVIRMEEFVFDLLIQLPEGPERRLSEARIDQLGSVTRMGLEAARAHLGEDGACPVGMERGEALRIVVRLVRFHPCLIENVAGALADLRTPILTQVLILR